MKVHGLFFLLTTLLMIVSITASMKQYTVFYTSLNKAKNFAVVKGIHNKLPASHRTTGFEDDPVAWCQFDDDVQKDGWGKLTIKTNEKFDNEKQAMAAGFVEGHISAHLIGPYWDAFKQYNYNASLSRQFDNFIDRQYDYLASQSVAKGSTGKPKATTEEEQYWNQVGLILAQVRGMYTGYYEATLEDSSLKPMSFQDFWKFQYDGDTSDIESALSPSNFDNMNYEQLTTVHLIRTKCSAFLKYTADRSNLLITHSTWDTFANMLRIYKHVELNYKNEGPLAVEQASNLVSFSSSPAWLVSVDDFYITSAGLVVLETTNNVFNNTLYNYVKPEAAPFWVRNAVANRMARTAPEWTRLFSIENGGTYNNQWMIIDTKKFVEGSSQSDPDLFHVLEQLPGTIRTESQSAYLDKNGYWASYNIPYYSNIYQISGYAELAKKYGDYWTHDHCPRANIFRKYQEQVQSVDELKYLIRRNDWQKDPFSLGDACNQIAARCDLNSPSIGEHYRAFGQIDAKITDIQMAKNMQAVAQNGPTHYEPSPVFSWNSIWANKTAHVLQPETFLFDWIEMSPANLN